jgi:hypothetical protein
LIEQFDNLENTTGQRPEAIPGQMTRRRMTDGTLAKATVLPFEIHLSKVFTERP